MVVFVLASFARLIFKQRCAAFERDACYVGWDDLLRIVARLVGVFEKLPLVEFLVLIVGKYDAVLLRVGLAFF